jgi:hypothetical protein
MKRAEPLPGVPRLLQSRVLADDLDDVRRRPNVGENAFVQIEGFGHGRTIARVLALI